MMYLHRESLLAIVFYIWMDCTIHRQEGALLKERVSLLHTYLHCESCFKLVVQYAIISGLLHEA